MPDPTTTHPVDALLPVIRAALLRAYDHGAADAVQKLVAQIAPQPRASMRPQRRAGYGAVVEPIRRALHNGANDARSISDATGIDSDSVRVRLSSMLKNGEIIRTAPGRYAPATQVSP